MLRLSVTLLLSTALVWGQDKPADGEATDLADRSYGGRPGVGVGVGVSSGSYHGGQTDVNVGVNVEHGHHHRFPGGIGGNIGFPGGGVGGIGGYPGGGVGGGYGGVGGGYGGVGGGYVGGVGGGYPGGGVGGGYGGVGGGYGGVGGGYVAGGGYSGGYYNNYNNYNYRLPYGANTYPNTYNPYGGGVKVGVGVGVYDRRRPSPDGAAEGDVPEEAYGPSLFSDAREGFSTSILAMDEVQKLEGALTLKPATDTWAGDCNFQGKNNYATAFMASVNGVQMMQCIHGETDTLDAFRLNLAESSRIAFNKEDPEYKPECPQKSIITALFSTSATFNPIDYAKCTPLAATSQQVNYELCSDVAAKLVELPPPPKPDAPAADAPADAPAVPETALSVSVYECPQDYAMVGITRGAPIETVRCCSPLKV